MSPQLESIAMVVMGCVAVFLAIFFVKDFLRRKQVSERLEDRVQLSDEAFRKTYYPENDERGLIASRVRRVLSNNLETPLGGLCIDDRLDEDLFTETEANPHLLWELEEEFEMSSPDVDQEELDRFNEQVRTFRDLVLYMEERLASGKQVKRA